MILAVDFDGVIYDYNGKPIPGAIDALDELYSDGHEIIIHSSKANTASGKAFIKSWLDNYGVDYREVVGKPEADFYIDDKAVEFKNWASIIEKLEIDGI